MIDIVHQAGASLAGVGIVIEKGFQEGGSQLREQGLKAVSYTHLDVYKRQLPICEQAAWVQPMVWAVSANLLAP